MNILVFNAGSSSLKFGCYEHAGAALRRTLNGSVERIAHAEAELVIERPNCSVIRESVAFATYAAAVQKILEKIELSLSPKVLFEAIGCRVVHGGPKFAEPVLVNDQVLKDIRSLSALAPLHNPLDTEIIETCRRFAPDIPVVAVFDTAFHHSLPAVAATYAIPQELSGKFGLRRYGFHGIAHQDVSGKLLEQLPRSEGEIKVITCHLGNGASVCAIKNGQSIDTSMGFTPMEGLMMGTRSGDIDPGLLLYLIETGGLSPAELNNLLNKKSGLLGVSDRSADVRDLEQAAAGSDKNAGLALEGFAYRVSKYIGAYIAALDGIDAVAFSGGIGENSASMRRRICNRLRFFGLMLDENANSAGPRSESTCISASQSKTSCWIIRADEGQQIAKEAAGLLARNH